MSALDTLKSLQSVKQAAIKLPDSEAVIHVQQLTAEKIFLAGVIGREIQKETGEPIQDLKARLVLLAASICEEDGSQPKESIKELLAVLELLPMATSAYLLDKLQEVQTPNAASVANEDVINEAIVEQAKKSEAVPSSDSTAASDS